MTNALKITLLALLFLWPVRHEQHGIWMADTYGGSAADKVRSCINDAIQAGGGTCDALSLGGVQKMTGPIAVGNAAAVPVTLLVPNVARWQWDEAMMGCAITVYDKSAIVGDAASGEGTPFVIQALDHFKGEAGLCTMGLTGDSDQGTDSYFTVRGVGVSSSGGSQLMADVILRNAADSSRFESIEAVPTGNGQVGILAEYDCCGAIFEGVGADGFGATKATIPGVFRNFSGIVLGGSFVHAPTGSPSLLVDNGSSAASPQFYGIYIENSTTTSQVRVTASTVGGSSAAFFGLTCTIGTQASCLQIDGKAHNVMATQMRSSSPAAIDDEVDGITVNTEGGLVRNFDTKY